MLAVTALDSGTVLSPRRVRMQVLEASRMVPRGEAIVRGESASDSFDVPLEGAPPVLKLTLRPIAP